MPRTANAKIKNATQRSKLKPRTAPYFETIAPKVLLGYLRKGGETVAGSWLVRVETGRSATGAARRAQKALGTADDIAGANGISILSYEQAYKAASGPNPTGSTGGRAFTVRQAADQHLDYGGKKGDKVERNKVRAHQSLVLNVLREKNGEPLPGPTGLGEVAVNDLTTEQLTAWRDAMIRKDLQTTDERAYLASRVTAERKWTNFRSCLEQAYKRASNGIKSADAWRNVESLGKKGNAREVHFEMDEALRYIERARANGDRAAADLFEAYAWTGSRPGGELASLSIADFKPRLRLLLIPDRSETVISKTGHRKIILTEEAVEFFTRVSAGRPSSALLLPDPDGERWDSKQRSRYFKDVLVRAGAPKEATPYAFRHSFISRWVETGESLKLIGKSCGTSVDMIEQVYAKSLPSKELEMVQKSAPKLRLVKGDEQQAPLPVAA